MRAEVWWLPPQVKLANESSIDFANRIKAMISETANLENLSWNGYMKNYLATKDQERLAKKSQIEYVMNLKKALNKENRKPIHSAKSDTKLSKLVEKPLDFPSWLPESSEIDLKNMMLRDGGVDVMKSKNDIVETWKQYTKIKKGEVHSQRVEYQSWRYWFKQQNESRNKCYR
jgi:hypothetical protein